MSLDSDSRDSIADKRAAGYTVSFTCIIVQSRLVTMQREQNRSFLKKYVIYVYYAPKSDTKQNTKVCYFILHLLPLMNKDV
jgi:hypothetical protein